MGKIESLLFVASKPMTISGVAKAIGCSVTEAEQAISELRAQYERENRGIRIFASNDEVQMGTDPLNRSIVEQFITDETAGELTRAQLETLTIVAYRGPITRPELEQIRGVNCAVILRTLLMRGFVEEDEGPLASVYRLSMNALSHLGITSPAELPEYERFHAHEFIEQMLMKRDESDRVPTEE